MREPPRAYAHSPRRPLALLQFSTGPLLLGLDLVVIAAALLLAGGTQAAGLLLLGLLVILYDGAGLYLSRLTLSALDDAPALVGRLLAATMLTLEIEWLAAHALDLRLMRALPLLAVAVLVERAISYEAVRRCRTRGWVSHRTLLLGGGRVAGQIASTLSLHPEYGLVPIGFLDSDPLLALCNRPVPLLGDYDALAAIIRQERVGVVIVAFGSAPESQMIRILRECDKYNCAIFLVPRLFELSYHAREMDQVWGIPLVRRNRRAFRLIPRLIKRGIDLTIAAVALVALSPLLLAVATCVRVRMGKGVLFHQERVGVDGRRFTVLKFRTLHPVDDHESATRWCVANDQRLGRLGRLLRATSIDELPQLVNVLRGEMSLVGPRPERPHFVTAFSDRYPHYMARHRVPSGLTGWAQVHGLRGDTSIDERARFDNAYIESWSLWTDAKIVIRTMAHLLRGSGR